MSNENKFIYPEEPIKNPMTARNAAMIAATATANANINFIEIERKGPNGTKVIIKYAPVNERVKAFRYIYPEGQILTEIIDNDKENKSIIIKATIKNEFGAILSQATAGETLAGSYINKTSMIENCETSAIGRALGLLNIGIDGGIASADDMARAQKFKDAENNLKLCRRCNRPIIDAMDKKGNMIKADDIAAATLKAYGDTYCLPCAAILKNTNIKLLEVEK